MSSDDIPDSSERTPMGQLLGRPLVSRRVDLWPPIILAAFYLAGIICGTVALRQSWAAHEQLSWGEALFTATSAITVTGLSVVPLSETLTTAGWTVLAVLIEVGGLGLMCLAALAFTLLGFQMRERMVPLVMADLGTTPDRRLMQVTLQILISAMAIQALGWLVLWWGTGDAAEAAFLAISAFNNAGFTPYASSLDQVAQEPLVLAPIAVLFVVGGLGFIVLGQLWDRFFIRQSDTLAPHAKLVLISAGVLTVVGALGLYVFEGGRLTLGLAVFQSLTPRTAGFDAGGVDEYSTASLLLTIVLMFVGAGATSTGGGIKMTTAALVAFALIAYVRGRGSVTFLGIEISRENLKRVVQISFGAVVLVAGGTFCFMVAEKAGALDAAFEVTSAFGTVGLSRGLSEEAGTGGRIIIGMMMFLGRIGPVSLAYLIFARFIGPPGKTDRDFVLG